MNPFDVASRPTVINNTHESLFRSYHLLALVERWLADGVPAPVVLEWVAAIRVAAPVYSLPTDAELCS